MKQLKVLLLLNLFYYTFGFTKIMCFPQNVYNNRHCNLCKLNMIDNRREILKMPLNILKLSSLLPFNVKAYEPDSSWTEHKGPYNENEIQDFIKTDSGLLYKDIKQGRGNMPNDGDAVSIYMVGYIFETGDKWSNTYKGIPSYQSTIRAGPRKNQKIMKGLNEGVKTMKKGGKRILIIPPYLAYNYITIFSEQNPNVIIIPGGATLVCYIEVIDFKPIP